MRGILVVSLSVLFVGACSDGGATVDSGRSLPANFEPPGATVAIELHEASEPSDPIEVEVLGSWTWYQETADRRARALVVLDGLSPSAFSGSVLYRFGQGQEITEAVAPDCSFVATAGFDPLAFRHFRAHRLVTFGNPGKKAWPLWGHSCSPTVLPLADTVAPVEGHILHVTTPPEAYVRILLDGQERQPAGISDLASVFEFLLWVDASGAPSLLAFNTKLLVDIDGVATNAIDIDLAQCEWLMEMSKKKAVLAQELWLKVNGQLPNLQLERDGRVRCFFADGTWNFASP